MSDVFSAIFEFLSNIFTTVVEFLLTAAFWAVDKLSVLLINLGIADSKTSAIVISIIIVFVIFIILFAIFIGSGRKTGGSMYDD